MLGKLIGFEIRFHTRQVGFWITVGIMFLVGLLVISTDAINISSATGERVKANGAITLALQTSIFSLFSMFFGAVFVVSGVMRDQVYKALEMVHATPVTTRDMTLSRMVGVYVATFLCIFGALIGLFAGQFAPWIDKESLGTINPLYFLQPALIYVAVNTLLISGIFTTIAAITRDRALVYVSAVALFILFTTSGLFVGEDAPDWLTSIIDPFGSNALALTTEFWPAAEQNTRMSPITGLIGINRLVWGGVGLALYLATFGLFRRGLIGGKTKKLAQDEEQDTGRIILHGAPTRQSGFGTFWTRLKYEYLTTVRSIPFIILTLLAIALFGITIYFQMEFIPNPALPTSLLMAQTVIGTLLIPLLIIIVFFSGEMVWRDKTAQITEILDASPVANWPLMAGKWLALIGVVTTLFAVGIVFGMITQTVIGDIPINPMSYLQFTFVTFAPRIFLFCLLVLFIQNFMPNRVVGMLTAGALIIFFLFIIGNLPFAHPLMRYGAFNNGGLSELNGYADLTNLKWFGLYWGSLGALFVVLSIWLWRRGLQSSLLVRLKTLGNRLTLPSMAIATLLLAGFVGSGAYIYKGYNINNNFRTTKQNELRQVKWENLLGKALKKPIPKVRSVEADITFNPSAQTATIKGRYVIENTTNANLRDLYINMPAQHVEDNRSLTIKGATRVTDDENITQIENFGTRIYRFDPPLAPGEKTQMAFETFIRAPELGDRSPIQRNGTFVNNFAVMPQIGIQDRRMVNPDRRRKNDLPKREKRADRTNTNARQNNFITRSADYVDFKSKICTDKGQIPITPGKLVREYEENGKACRDYQAINPILNFFSFLSADFEVKKDLWENPNGDNVDLAIYYHKTHGYNVDLMIEAMKNSLTTFTTTFGPYQYNQIRIMEFPYASFAQSFAGTIPFSENIGFVMDPGDPDDIENVDLATYVVMHEIGHQWFAHQIVPANTKGFNVLSEGLTENAAMTAYEDALGWQKARRVLEQRSIQTYLTRRGGDREDEPPLAKAGNQQYLVYNKASWVFWGLKQYMGKDLMQGAIRGFLDEYGSKGPPYPTTKELVAALRAAAPANMQGLITDYWDRITFWDLKFDDDITVKPNTDGGYTVDLTAIVDKKIASEEDGKETSVSEIDGESLNEWIEIGFYKEDPKKTLGDEWLKLERVRITDATTALSFDLDERPAFVLLDPRRLLMERNIKDNVKTLPKDKLASND